VGAPGYSLRGDLLLWSLVGVLLVFSTLHPAGIAAYPRLVDWPTIAILAGLLLLTAGVEVSGYLQHLAAAILEHVPDERRLALFLCGTAALLATVLTNDIALFIVVPLTLGLHRQALIPVRRLVIFEALAVNTGSMLTPIGNPQNIFLWERSGVHFHAFVLAMWPPVLVAGLALLAFVWCGFRPRALHLHDLRASYPVRKPVLYISLSLFPLFLVLADLRHVALALLLTMAVYLVAFRPVLRRIDWPLLCVFVLMFVDLRLVGKLSWVASLLGHLDLGRPLTLFGTGALLSQAMSNVPATILLSGYSSDWRSLAWGVDVGGFGIVIGSLASLIALRLGRQPGSFWAFHAWSLPFFLLCTAVTGLWLRLSGG